MKNFCMIQQFDRVLRSIFIILHSSFSVLKLKKSSRSVSRVLFSVFRKKSSLFIHYSSFSKVSVIYLSRMLPYRLQRSTLRHGASSSHSVGLHDLTTPKTHSPCVTTRLVGSYPTFSPLPMPKDTGGYFLLRYSTLADSFLLGSRMLYVARTFLIRRSVSDRPTGCFCPAKIRFLCQRTQKLVEFLCKGGLFPYLLHNYRYGPGTDRMRGR